MEARQNVALQTFIICADADSPDTQRKVLESFKENDNAYVVRENSQWLVAAEMTTRQVYEKIELQRDDKPGIVVFLTVNYWGSHKKDMWEWLELD